MENNDPFRILEEENDKESHLIEQLEKKLYSRQDEVKLKERTVLRPKKFGHAEEWEGALDYKKTINEGNGSPYLKFFLFSFVFFIIAAGIAGYSLLSKRIVITPENVSVSLFGPVSLKGGEELSVQVLIENKNTVPLSMAQLTADFPDGSRYVNNPDQKLTRSVKNLDAIDGGEVRTEIVKAIVLGTENERKEMLLTVRFSIEGSNAVYTKTKKFNINLTTPPLSFSASTLEEATPGQQFVLGVDIKSNSSTVIDGGLFKVEYPKGFVFAGASPAPSLGDNMWLLGPVGFGTAKHIEIKGSLLGESDQQKVFHLSVGTGADNDKYTMGTLFGNSQTIVTIKKPFLGISIFVDGSNTDEPIIREWTNSEINVQWTNSLKNKVIDGEIEVSLEGDVINQKSVSPDSSGYYDSFKHTLFWDKRVVSELTTVSPGKKGEVGFSFNLIPFSKTNMFKNPVVTISTSVKGKRIDENNVPEEIHFFSSKKVKINTELQLDSRGTYYLGPLKNRGPLPPKVGQETTYTITWRVTNTINDVSNAEVTASIPLSVRYMKMSFPSGAPITYNQTSHEVLWSIGTIRAGTGYNDEPKEVSFQVSLLPGLSQVAGNPMLISKAVLTAIDDFTGEDISSEAGAVNTIITEFDPQVEQEDVAVVE